jgi:hypothetical protein
MVFDYLTKVFSRNGMAVKHTLAYSYVYINFL